MFWIPVLTGEWKDGEILGSPWDVVKGIHRGVHCPRESLIIAPCRLQLGEPSFCQPHSFRKGAFSLPQKEPPRARISLKVPVTCHVATPLMDSATVLGLTRLTSPAPLLHLPLYSADSLVPFSLLPRIFQCLHSPYSPLLPSSQPFLSGVLIETTVLRNIFKILPKMIND